MFQFGEYLEKVELYEKVMDEIERIVHDKGKMTLYGFKTAGAAM